MDWIEFARWAECMAMQRPGIVFEVSNAAGQTLMTECVVPLVVPFDWTSPPSRFRAVAEPAPQHSRPLPPPAPADRP